MSLLSLMREDLIFLNRSFLNKEELIRFGSSILEKKGFVLNEYCEEVIGREEKYPTGLSLGDVNAAIPHSEIDFVKSPAVLFISLENSIMFKNMENPSEEVTVKIVFMLAINDGHEHMYILQDLVKILQTKELVELLTKIEKKSDVLELIGKCI